MSYTPPIKRKVSVTIQKLHNLYWNPKVKLLKKALKGFTKSYGVDIIINQYKKNSCWQINLKFKFDERLEMGENSTQMSYFWKTK